MRYLLVLPLVMFAACARSDNGACLKSATVAMHEDAHLEWVYVLDILHCPRKQSMCWVQELKPARDWNETRCLQYECVSGKWLKDKAGKETICLDHVPVGTGR